MMAGGDRKVIVIKKKKKGGHGGHHGGSWKVAYADFVTAMMAFFLVMWIVGLDQGSKELVQGYFSNPVGFKKAFSGGQNPLSQGNSPQNLGIQRVAMMARNYQAARFEEAATEIEEKLRDAGLNDSIRGEVEIVVTDQGLRIELMESGGDDTFFDRSSAALKPRLREILTVIAGELRILPNDVVVEGHTDAMPFKGRGDYSNWELSSDRANAARRVLERGGLGGDRITAVYGLAARQLKHPERPRDARNRRISVLLPFDASETESIPLLGPDDLSGALPNRTPTAGAQR